MLFGRGLFLKCGALISLMDEQFIEHIAITDVESKSILQFMSDKMTKNDRLILVFEHETVAREQTKVLQLFHSVPHESIRFYL